jgi:hypothetical protein
VLNCGTFESYVQFFKDEIFKKDTEGEYEKPKWIFRGQQTKKKNCKNTSDSDEWEEGKLQTHLEEYFELYQHDKEYDIIEIEENLIRSFKRKVHHFTDIKNIPNDEDTLEWLALMQHFEGPTRLLDWEYSFYIGLYFAINRCDFKKNRPEIWVMNAKWFEKQNEKILHKYAELKIEATREKKDVPTNFSNKLLNYLMKHPADMICSATPFRLNERMVYQQATFMCAGNIKKTFLENVARDEYKPQNENIFRIILDIDWKKRNDILWELNNMNINQAVLFPDLEGFAKNLKVNMAYPDKIYNLEKGKDAKEC